MADISRGNVVLASAGHLPPLLQASNHSGYVDVPIGVPLGESSPGYRSTTVVTAPGSLMVGFTDGLVERRGEALDVGLGRLQATAGTFPGSLEELVTGLVADLAQDAAEDDIAVLALRWVDR